MDPQQQPPQVPDPIPQVPTVGDGVDMSASDTVSAPALPATNVKQQVVEKVQNAKNVLVTVGSSPSVDELSSALGLTFLLGKLGKHVTAVFSGQTPAAIDFLDPDKTFERTVDSLRDFIIALDKEKADKLRYKVEEEVVKVYITPYKTTISEKDLEFSQGDFNVDVVVALGVVKRDELDSAITSHGRILHDAEVITINADGNTSNLGSIDWSDNAASSIAEMLVSISESFGSGLLDEQISTALLTGIVAETNRFSNEKTSPKVMTMSAQLMAAGANQQLIASNLRQEGAITESIRGTDADSPQSNGSEMVLSHDDESKGKNGKQKQNNQSQKGQNKKPKPDNRPQQNKPKQADTSATQSSSSSSPTQANSEPALVEQKKSSSEQQAQPATGVGTGDTSTQQVTPSQPSAPPMPPPSPAPGESQQSTESSLTPKIETHHSMVQPVSDAGSAPIGGQADMPSMGGSLNATAQSQVEQKATELDAERTNNESEPDSGVAEAEKAIEEARKALEEVENEQPFDPGNNPTESVGASELPPLRADTPQPDGSAPEMQAQTAVQQNAQTAAAEEPSPTEAFMQPHADTPGTPNMPNEQTAPPIPAPANGPGMPPPPPMPPSNPVGGTPDMPPLPPLPGQPSGAPATDPSAGFQPQTNPPFMQNVPQSQNSWTQAADDLAAKQSDKDAARQKKLDDMAADYDSAVDQNLINQGKPPVNNPDDHSTFPLPPSR